MRGVRPRPRLAFARGFDRTGGLARVLPRSGDCSLLTGPRRQGGLGRLLRGSYSRLGAQAWRQTGVLLGEFAQQLLDLSAQPEGGVSAGFLGVYDRREPSVKPVDVRLERLLGEHHVPHLFAHAVDGFGERVVLIRHVVEAG